MTLFRAKGLKGLSDTGKFYHAKFKVYQPKRLLFLPVLIILFLHQLICTKIETVI